MIRVRKGDLFQSKAQTRVNTVNCMGVMGKGIALEFKKRFPEMYKDYVRRCGAGEVKLGQPYLYRPQTPPWILNFPTKSHWREASRLSDIVAGLQYLERHYKEWGIQSLACPALGCNNGRLDWAIVGPILYRYLSRLEIEVELYGPQDAPEELVNEAFLQGQDAGLGGLFSEIKDDAALPLLAERRIEKLASITEALSAWVVIAETLARVLGQPCRWKIGRTAFQTMVYFATAEGLPTGLVFRWGGYGPYSDTLRDIVQQLVNDGLLEESKDGSWRLIRPGIAYPAVRTTYHNELTRWDALIRKVADLFSQMNTQEIRVAATVHFVTKELQQKSASAFESVTEQVVLEAMERRHHAAFSKVQVTRAIRTLNRLGWVRFQPADDLPLSAAGEPDVRF